MAWTDNLRIALLISLSIVLVAVLYRRFKLSVMARDRPVPLHAELLSLQVMYHPDRLRVEVRLPGREELVPAMLDGTHRPMRSWPSVQKEKGAHVLELPLDGHADGEYYFELASATQRTVRKFKLQRG